MCFITISNASIGIKLAKPVNLYVYIDIRADHRFKSSTTVDAAVSAVSRARTVYLDIYDESPSSFQILAEIFSKLSAVTSLRFCTTVRGLIPLTHALTTPSVIRAISIDISHPSHLHLLRHLTQFATHIYTNLNTLSYNPGPHLPATTYLVVNLHVDTYDAHPIHLTDTIVSIAPQFPHLEGLHVFDSRDLSFVPYCLPPDFHHPTLRYIFETFVSPTSHLPRMLSSVSFRPPIPFCPSTSYLDYLYPNPYNLLLGHTCDSTESLGAAIAAFLLASFRVVQHLDPFVISYVLSHLTDCDGISGPESIMCYRP